MLTNTLNLFGFPIFRSWAYPMKVIPYTGKRIKLDIYICITITGSIPLLVDYKSLTWFIRYIYYWNLQFLNYVIIIKTKLLLYQA